MKAQAIGYIANAYIANEQGHIWHQTDLLTNNLQFKAVPVRVMSWARTMFYQDQDRMADLKELVVKTEFKHNMEKNNQLI